ELLGVLERDHLVVTAVKYQCGLRDIRIVLVPRSVLKQPIPDTTLDLLPVVIHRQPSRAAPLRDLFLPQLQRPPPRESERGSEQRHPAHLRMTRRVQSRQIPTHAGPDQPHILAAAGSRFDHAQLPAEGQALEITFAQIGNSHLDTKLLKTPAKKLRLARHGTGSEAVQINEFHPSISSYCIVAHEKRREQSCGAQIWSVILGVKEYVHDAIGGPFSFGECGSGPVALDAQCLSPREKPARGPAADQGGNLLWRHLPAAEALPRGSAPPWRVTLQNLQN